MNHVYTVTEHNIETKSDCLRGIYQSEETANKRAETIKEEYKRLTGEDNFNEFYLLRVERMEVE